jgi:hypothetical protein
VREHPPPPQRTRSTSTHEYHPRALTDEPRTHPTPRSRRSRTRGGTKSAGSRRSGAAATAAAAAAGAPPPARGTVGTHSGYCGYSQRVLWVLTAGTVGTHSGYSGYSQRALWGHTAGTLSTHDGTADGRARPQLRPRRRLLRERVSARLYKLATADRCNGATDALANAWAATLVRITNDYSL